MAIRAQRGPRQCAVTAVRSIQVLTPVVTQTSVQALVDVCNTAMDEQVGQETVFSKSLV